jgi:TolA-binding protein
MSEDDLLARALHALRDAHDGHADTAERTRQRILSAHRSNRRRRFRVVRLVLPIAAVLALGTAWAATTGRLDRLVRPRDRANAGGALRPRSSEPALVPAAPALIATATPDAADDAPSPLVVPTPSIPSPSAASSARAAGAEQALYQRAHTAHFAAHDSSAALAAWDAYLAAYPRGQFALEARYNRAICLARLGRTDEARTALTPFAEGKFGGYRRAEARELLEVLDTK